MLGLHKFLLRRQFTIKNTFLSSLLIYLYVFDDNLLIYPRFESWESGLYVLLLHLHHSLSTFLLSGPHCSRLILSYICPSTGVNHIYKDFWHLLVEKLFRKPDLGAGFATEISLLLGSLRRHLH